MPNIKGQVIVDGKTMDVLYKFVSKDTILCIPIHNTKQFFYTNFKSLSIIGNVCQK